MNLPDEKLTQTELHLVIYSRLNKVFPKAATYDTKVKQLIREYLPIINLMTPATVAPVIKGLRTLIQRDEWVNVSNMFKGIFVFLAKSQNPQLQYKHIDQFLAVYPEFSDLPEDERKALFEYRNTIVAAMLVFDPRDKKSDFFGLVGRTFGPAQTAYFESSLFTTRRILIYERETNTAPAAAPAKRVDPAADKKRAPVPAPPPVAYPFPPFPTIRFDEPAEVSQESAEVVESDFPSFPVLSPKEEARQGHRLLNEALSQILQGRTPVTIAQAPLYTTDGACEVRSPLLPALHYLLHGYVDCSALPLPLPVSSQANTTNPLSIAAYLHISHHATDPHYHSHSHSEQQEDLSHFNNVTFDPKRLQELEQAHFAQESIHGILARLLAPPNPHDIAMGGASHPSLAPLGYSTDDIIANPARCIYAHLPSFAARNVEDHTELSDSSAEVSFVATASHIPVMQLHQENPSQAVPLGHQNTQCNNTAADCIYNPRTAQMGDAQNHQRFPTYSHN